MKPRTEETGGSPDTLRRCAFLTLGDSADYVVDDDLAHGPLRALGWHVDNVPWRLRNVDWTSYDAVVIRSTYDYVTAPDEFLGVVTEIAESGTQLYNSLELVRWNLRKTYLRDLADRGVPTVPTLWRTALTRDDLPVLFDELGADEIVIKPVIGANAGGAFRIARGSSEADAGEITAYYADRDAMVQPFVHNIAAEGEYSLFYFDGIFSHAILKTPKAADFRVQEEHGGLIRSILPSAELRAAGDLVLATLGETPLYARADLVRDACRFLLMELELIEPSLYFRTDDNARTRFAEALDLRWRRSVSEGWLPRRTG